MTKRVVVDADVLGRQRTGDETYVRNLLRELVPLAEDADLELVAVTRKPELVPTASKPSSFRRGPRACAWPSGFPRRCAVWERISATRSTRSRCARRAPAS